MSFSCQVSSAPCWGWETRPGGEGRDEKAGFSFSEMVELEHRTSPRQIFSSVDFSKLKPRPWSEVSTPPSSPRQVLSVCLSHLIPVYFALRFAHWVRGPSCRFGPKVGVIFISAGVAETLWELGQPLITSLLLAVLDLSYFDRKACCHDNGLGGQDEEFSQCQ